MAHEPIIGLMATPAADFRKIVFANTLRGCQLFTGLPADDLELISSFVIPKEIKKGQYLFREGATSEGFYVVQRGAVNVHRVSAHGKEQVISVFRTGQSFAEAALASAGGYPADARAIEDSTVLLVPKADFLGLLRSRPELALRMLGSMSQHLRVIVGLLDDLTLKDVETRLANWLLKRCPRPLPASAVEFQLDRTKRVLAAEIGTVSETLSRTFADFREKKLIRVAGKVITILEPKRLERILQRNLGEL
jgi:CRP/FNR family transcriptional regulator, dissimilatory nitrate respiration regulator